MSDGEIMRPMSIWTREQISQVRGLRAQASVDTTVDDRALVDIKAAARWKMARSLTQMAHPFAVELHEADFQFAEREDEDRPWEVIIRCWWEPDVRTVEIRGGHIDGTLLEIERPGEPFKIPTPMSPTFLTDEDALHPTEMAPMSLLVEMTGWDETHRRWVYEIRR